MELSDILCCPVWAVSTVLLAIVVRLQRRSCWDPKTCQVRLTGKTAIVTGANTGIGKITALNLARHGARVILACRSEARGTAALEQIRKETGNADVHLRIVDLSSLSSVREFAKKIVEEEKALHILVNNAAVSGVKRGITGDGFELTFATNHLGPFLLTNLLLDLLKRSAPSRIVTVTSTNHRLGAIDFSHFHGENLSHNMDVPYNHTKLHNLICTNELARRLQGTGVTANSVHPGIVRTEVMRHYPLWLRWLFNFVGFFFFKSPTEGAVSSLYCALAEELEGVTGKYFDSDCSLTLPAPLARDAALAVKDFEHCERLTSKL